MPRDSIKVRQVSGLALLLFGAPAVVEPGVTAFAAVGFPEIADASLFGRQGTVVVGVVAAVLSAVSVVLAWRGVPGVLRTSLAVLLGVAAGLVAVTALSFLLSGGTSFLFAVLLIHATFSIGMIAWAVQRSAPTGEGRRGV